MNYKDGNQYINKYLISIFIIIYLLIGQCLINNYYLYIIADYYKN